MSWTTVHQRGAVLRDVIRALDADDDGRLPMDLPGVRQAFGDELGLLGALQLRWHTRLSGNLERAVAHESLDGDAAALAAWRRTADELPGTRRALDRHRASHPARGPGAEALAVAAAKDHVLLAAMAGRAGATTADTAAAGRALEARARAGGAMPVR